ncbi:MAG: dadA, partial [Mucilaginibacter sp.]|nr:dadA [Mucilaginibacter sp.]
MFYKIYNLYFKNSHCFLTIQQFHTYDLPRLEGPWFMSKVIIIGGGIIGLFSAYYLQKSGWEVEIIDQGDLSDNCSYGNAGM